MRVAVLGAGGGGAAAAVEHTRVGHEVRLWSRAPAGFDDGIAHDGVFGEGVLSPALLTTDIGAAVHGADVLLVCLPTTAHAGIAERLIDCGERLGPVVLNPGHTGGALEFATVFARAGQAPPPLAELSTLTYVARQPAPGRVSITGRAATVRAACLPGGDAALSAAAALYPGVTPAADVLATGLSNVNMVLHPPGAVLGAAWVEATGGDFTFYVDGLTDGVARVMGNLDDERRAVASAYGHDLPPLFDEMRAIGTIEAGADPAAGLAAAIRDGRANARIKAPDALTHRYYREDFGHGLLPFLALARIAKVPVPAAAALFRLGEMLTGVSFSATGRTAAVMGLDGLDRAGVIRRVTGQ